MFLHNIHSLLDTILKRLHDVASIREKELKKDTYTEREARNVAVKKIVADSNQRPFQNKSDIPKSRMNGFEKYDIPRMN